MKCYLHVRCLFKQILHDQPTTSKNVDCQFENEACTREERARLGTLMLGPFPARAAQELERFIGLTDQTTINGLETLIARCVRGILSESLAMPEAETEPCRTTLHTDTTVDEDSPSPSYEQDWFRQVQVEDPTQPQSILQSIRQVQPQLFQTYVESLQQSQALQAPHSQINYSFDADLTEFLNDSNLKIDDDLDEYIDPGIYLRSIENLNC